MTDSGRVRGHVRQNHIKTRQVSPQLLRRDLKHVTHQQPSIFERNHNRLPIEQFPNVEFPVVVVTTAWPGASPETVESDITRPIEEQVNTISGVYELSSRSFEGNSVVIIRFDLTVDPAQAAQDVRVCKPEGSRKESYELYLLGLRKK